jgi:hypothetical protein
MIPGSEVGFSEPVESCDLRPTGVARHAKPQTLAPLHDVTAGSRVSVGVSVSVVLASSAP